MEPETVERRRRSEEDEDADALVGSGRGSSKSSKRLWREKGGEIILTNEVLRHCGSVAPWAIIIKMLVLGHLLVRSFAPFTIRLIHPTRLACALRCTRSLAHSLLCRNYNGIKDTHRPPLPPQKETTIINFSSEFCR